MDYLWKNILIETNYLIKISLMNLKFKMVNNWSNINQFCLISVNHPCPKNFKFPPSTHYFVFCGPLASLAGFWSIYADPKITVKTEIIPRALHDWLLKFFTLVLNSSLYSHSFGGMFNVIYYFDTYTLHCNWKWSNMIRMHYRSWCIDKNKDFCLFCNLYSKVPD